RAPRGRAPRCPGRTTATTTAPARRSRSGPADFAPGPGRARRRAPMPAARSPAPPCGTSYRPWSRLLRRDNRRDGTLGTSAEQNGNEKSPAPASASRTTRVVGLRLRHLAGGVVGPVAIDADHAPFNAPDRADRAAVLDDGIVHRPPAAIRDQGHAGA